MDTEQILEEYVGKTSAELKDWFAKNPTDDSVLKQQRKIAYHHKVLIEKYDIDNLTVTQMDKLMEPKGAGLRARWALIRKQKKIVEDDAKRVVDFKAGYAAWVADGEKANMLQGINGNISVRADNG